MTYLFTNNQEVKNDIGNPLPVSKNTTVNSDANPIYVKGTADTSFFAPTQSDAFGRLRVSEPYTLFDSVHRYQDNGLISQATAVGGNTTQDSNSSTVLMNVTTSSGSYVKRESSKVFAYQPGKSLHTLQTFAMATPKANLRQRIGYFGESNGIFLEQDGLTLNLVRRTSSSGTLQEYRVPQSSWNVNTMIVDGNSTLFVDRTQIFWTDIEWLGVGSVRCGFIIDGEYVHVHTFHHANRLDPITGNPLSTSYMGTAMLPVRAEIENTGATASNSTFRLICTTVLSEGGYNEVGRPRSVGHALASPYSVASSGVLYPVFSMRLKSGRLDGLVLPKNFGISVTGNTNYRWRIVKGGTTTGGTWIDAGASDSSVEYNLTGTSFTGGNLIETGYIINSNQASAGVAAQTFPFKYQLERNTFTSTAYEFTICVETTGTNQTAWCSVNWEELT